MTDYNAGSHWPGTDERLVVEEMLRDRYSKHWEECRTVVKQCVYVNAKNIPTNRREEIVQEAMIKIVKSLPGFHSGLKAWLKTTINNCIIDEYRKLCQERQFTASLSDLPNENDCEVELRIISKSRSAENTFILNEELRNAIVALWEYAGMHSNPARDRLIVRMVIFEGHNRIETAKVAGCNAPVVGYVVREAQRYAREKMGHKL